MFIDEIKVFARAGHGGRGSVILEADHDLNNLLHQFYQPKLIAEKGEHGLGKGMDGHAGKDLIVKVPCGTLVWHLASPAPAEVESDEDDDDDDDEKAPPKSMVKMLRSSTGSRPVLRSAGAVMAMEYDLSKDDDNKESQRNAEKGELIADLTQHGQQFILCKGGRGGLGNRNFATAARQAPRFAQPGEPGGEGDYLFELRILAEVGLVGYPNAGKSTLLTAISKARPKVAPYPFTTLTPQIGIVEFPDYKRLTVCDVPGLIEGAHKNVGLGHAFLRHIERCKIIILLIDMAGTDNREPWEDYRQLLKELELYDTGLLDKPRFIVANKMDEPQAEANLKVFKRKIRKIPVLPISAAFDQAIDKFKQLIREAVEEVQRSEG